MAGRDLIPPFPPPRFPRNLRDGWRAGSRRRHAAFGIARLHFRPLSFSFFFFLLSLPPPKKNLLATGQLIFPCPLSETAGFLSPLLVSFLLYLGKKGTDTSRPFLFLFPPPLERATRGRWNINEAFNLSLFLPPPFLLLFSPFGTNAYPAP